MSKQDRQGARTVSDLEQKYQYSKKFAEIMGVATDARNLALEAKNSYDGLTHEQIFNLLTRDGALEGLYEENGNVYINASYIKTGELSADLIKTGTINADLIKSGTINADLIKTGTLSGNLIKAGVIKSSNYSASLGMSIDLDNGVLNSPKFKVNNLGEITATGGRLGNVYISEKGLSVSSITVDRQEILSIDKDGVWSQTTTAADDYATKISGGLLITMHNHSNENFCGAFAYHLENGAMYRIFIDPDTMTVKAALET